MFYLVRIKSKIKSFKRSIRFWWQRRIRGWDDSQTWSLDHSLAKLILPRLKRFQELSIGRPSDMTEKKWNDILDEMIFGFEWYASNKRWYSFPYAEIER